MKPGANEPGFPGFRHIRYWVMLVLCLSFFSFLVRPLVFDAIDYWNTQRLTEDDLKESMGLPFKVVKPPIGEQHLLNRDQIRWVLMQEIRLNSMQSVLHWDNPEAIKDFRAMMDDYNSRVMGYRYGTSDMEVAASDIAKYEEQIREHAIAEARELGWDVVANDH